MANAWDSKATDMWHSDLQDTVKEWQEFWGTRNKPRRHSRTHVSDGLQKIPLAHGSFDNDVDAMTRILKRILGKNLKFPIENLCGY
ncbi:MAG: hypothetical protein ACERKU_01140 [Nitrospirota bacterium]